MSETKPTKTIAHLTAEVDMSQLDAAAAKAERLMEMLTEIEARSAAIDARAGGRVVPVASGPQIAPPPKPQR